jgi:tagaturonate epimerase
MDEPMTIPSRLSELNVPVYRNSVVEIEEATFCLVATEKGKRLYASAPGDWDGMSSFAGEAMSRGGQEALLCPLTHENAAALRGRLPWLTPAPLGLQTSAGCGDRIGLATPGHIRAAHTAGGGIAMIFAQQSIREMTRTGRSADEVMDDAMWGAFQEGWQEPVGADADHLKTTADIDRCVAAGYSFYTIDPGEHVDPAADGDDQATLDGKLAALPWDRLETTGTDLRQAYRGRRFELEAQALSIDEEALTRAAVKYGRAVAHVARMHRHLETALAGRAFDLEVSVDETDTPTSHAEHVFIAQELRRLGVEWVSLAPRYVGRFEKGVDYIAPGANRPEEGTTDAFRVDFAGHAAIARAFGPYKLSLHSGSDKFSIYGIAAELAGGLVHLKTAGTSYLEALRAAASFDPTLFRDILAFAIARYDIDKASYHISAELAKVPAPDTLLDGDLPGLLEQFDTRQVLHVTFGSVLTTPELKDRLVSGLVQNEETYYQVLERHFVRHLRPLRKGN